MRDINLLQKNMVHIWCTDEARSLANSTCYAVSPKRAGTHGFTGL